jgi:CSLREA domain-containing protein
VAHPRITTLLLSIALTVPCFAGAATLHVDSTADVLADDGACTLREAVIAANSDLASGASPGECGAGSGADVIEVPAGTYTLAIAGAAEDAAATGDLDLLGEVEIAGADTATTIIDGADLDRIFQVHVSVAAEIHDLTIRNGRAASPSPVRGGGIQNLGTLSLERSVVSENLASFGGSSPAGSGGGIHNAPGASLAIEDSTVSDNDAENAGGGILNEGALIVSRSTLSGNATFRLTALGGGGIYHLSGCAEVSNSTLSGNNAFGPNNANGGGIRGLAPLTVSHCTLTGNQVSGVTGDFLGLSIASSAATTLHNTILDGRCSLTLPTSLGGNVETTTDSCGLDDASDQTGVLVADLGLGALVDNDGPTRTHAIAATSVARDSAVAEGCPATDHVDEHDEHDDQHVVDDPRRDRNRVSQGQEDPRDRCERPSRPPRPR